MNIKESLIALAVIIVLSFIQNLINAKKVNRAKQFALPCIALLFSAVSVTAGYVMIDEIENLEFLKILENTPIWDFISPLLDSLVNAGQFIFNAAIILIFIIIKSVFCPICVFIWKKFDLTKHTSVKFYDFDTDYHEWFLKDEWCHLRKIILAMDCGTILGSAVYLSLVFGITDDPPVWSIVFPCAAVIFISEIYNFINGQTKREYEHQILGDDSYSNKVNHFYKIREVFENLLPEPLLSANTGIELSGKATPLGTVNRLMESEKIPEKITAEYFTQNDRCKNADNDNFKITQNLMERTNIIISSPFYRDHTLYLTLPMINSLLLGKKCLVVVGRNSVCDDIMTWLNEIMEDFSQTETLWKVRKLDRSVDEWDVGILNFTELYDHAVLHKNKENFEKTDFVLLIEPSLILNTGQVGLNIVSGEISKSNAPVYCILDRNTDGLVDTMSHVFRTEFVNVAASPLPKCMYTGMTWDADGDYIRQKLFDKQTRYLGNGIELAAIAVKNQIPHVSWYSETKVPVKDIKWIAGQYYNSICRYMNIPTEQNKLYEMIDFRSELWASSAEKESFIIAEDEFCNMFSTLRLFLSRGISQSFVNVFSENYLLRDYMRYNKQLFVSDPNAIPSMVPDYAKTERNTLIKLLILMTIRPVGEQEIIEEFRLVGIETNDPLDTISKMLKKYSYADSSMIRTNRVKSVSSDMAVILSYEYTISADVFNAYFSDTLKPAYFIVEEEKHNEDYIDAKMFSHVVQLVMPGQFVTYNGKYYIVRHISPMNGVILRRASDIFSERKYYRQIRTYSFDCIDHSEIVSLKKMSEMEVGLIRTDFKVETSGYLEMKDQHDLRTAKTIDLTDDPESNCYHRQYRNKTVMRIKLPETDDGVRFTFCLLLSEILKSVFPNAWHYIAVVSKQSGDIGGMLDKMVYSAEGLNDGDECIYIIEDSDIDLGIIEAIDRNLIKLLEITADYLEWHTEKMREPLSEKKDSFGYPENEIFPVSSAESGQPDTFTGVDASENTEQPQEISYFEESSFLSDEGAPELCHVDGTDIFDNDGMPLEDELLELQFKAIGLSPLTKTKYQRNCFLKFGYDEIDKRIKTDELLKYLRVRGLCDNFLTKARTRDVIQKGLLDLETDNHCDFCGLPLSAVSYEVLNDGRVRCNNCSVSAIKTVKEFKEIYKQTLGFMQPLYGIQYNFPIRIVTSDAKTIARGRGRIFVPSTEYTGRVLGYASRNKNQYSIIVENGSPRLATVDTLVHEMTHIWQYVNWDDKEITAVYKMDNPKETDIAKDIVYEGMAVWAAIQYLYQMGESCYAAQQEMNMNARKDAYGAGFRLYTEKYPLKKESELLRYTPFVVSPPLDREKVEEAVKSLRQK